jgi:hypothetical protein
LQILNGELTFMNCMSASNVIHCHCQHEETSDVKLHFIIGCCSCIIMRMRRFRGAPRLLIDICFLTVSVFAVVPSLLRCAVAWWWVVRGEMGGRSREWNFFYKGKILQSSAPLPFKWTLLNLMINMTLVMKSRVQWVVQCL